MSLPPVMWQNLMATVWVRPVAVNQAEVAAANAVAEAGVIAAEYAEAPAVTMLKVVGVDLTSIGRIGGWRTGRDGYCPRGRSGSSLPQADHCGEQDRGRNSRSAIQSLPPM
ncbi:MAG: hypothetical protein R2932_47095 [Caldilineaceae bacterium]